MLRVLADASTAVYARRAGAIAFWVRRLRVCVARGFLSCEGRHTSTRICRCLCESKAFAHFKLPRTSRSWQQGEYQSNIHRLAVGTRSEKRVYQCRRRNYLRLVGGRLMLNRCCAVIPFTCAPQTAQGTANAPHIGHGNGKPTTFRQIGTKSNHIRNVSKLARLTKKI